MRLAVTGMSCGRCKAKVERALENVPGVEDATVNLSKREAVVMIKEERYSKAAAAIAPALVAAVLAAGFGARILNDGEDDPAEVKELSHVGAATADAAAASNSCPSWTEYTFAIEGMTCGNCTGTVEKAALSIPGVVKAAASYQLSNAVVTVAAAGAAAKVTADAAADAIAAAGYDAVIDGLPVSLPPYMPPPGAMALAVAEATPIAGESSWPQPPLLTAENGVSSSASAEAVLDVRGMTCSSCVASVSKALLRVQGVNAADVSFPLERATVRFDAAQVGAAELVRAVTAAGYRATVARVSGSGDDSGGAPEDKGVDSGGDAVFEDVEKRAAKRKAAVAHERNFFLASLLFTVPVVLLDMVFGHLVNSPALMQEIIPGLMLTGLLQWALASPVQFYFGAPFYVRAWAELRRRSLGMSFLVASGTSAAYLYSFIALVAAVSTGGEAGDLFFETSSVLVSFVLLGKWLEAAARGKASGAVSRLLALAPRRAIRVRGGWPSNSKTATSSAISAASSGEYFGDTPAQEKDTSMAAEQKGGKEEGRERGEEEEDVAAASLAPGDVVKVVRGSRIPADGVVVGGGAAVDESVVTGESVPAARGVGSSVLAASVVVEGLAYVRVTRTGERSTLARIARLVEDAQASRAPLQDVGDHVASVFVPAVALLAAATFFLWFALAVTGVVPEEWREHLPGNPAPGLFALMFGLSVLVIACPCGVGLAAPTAVMVGATVAARAGVLLKGGDAVQKAAGVRAVLLDKTGTLTEGKPAVASFVLVLSDKARRGSLFARGILSFHGVLRLVAAAETASEHPVARAVVEYARAVGAAANGSGGDGGLASLVQEGSFKAESGRGVEAVVEGIAVRVGSPRYVLGGGGGGGDDVAVPPALAAAVRALQERGCTAVAAALDGAIVALIGVADRVRPEAPGVVKALHRMGLEVWMVTGDGAAAARAVAAAVGVPAGRVVAEVLPEHKADKVAELQAKGLAVAMVGDGINDAPALAKADVGVAMGGGAEVAVESADAVLMRPRLEDLVTTLHVCRAILRRIKLNYIWAMGYNVVALPIAAGVLFPLTKAALPPQLAGGLMALSSVSVVLSSLALRLYQPPKAARRLAKARARATGKEAPQHGEDVEMVGLKLTALNGRGDDINHGSSDGESDGEDESGFTPGAAISAAAAAAAAVVVTTVDLDCRCSCCRARGSAGGGGGGGSSLQRPASSNTPLSSPPRKCANGANSISANATVHVNRAEEEAAPLLADGSECSCSCSACGCPRH